jgi:hypothetical protein
VVSGAGGVVLDVRLWWMSRNNSTAVIFFIADWPGLPSTVRFSVRTTSSTLSLAFTPSAKIVAPATSWSLVNVVPLTTALPAVAASKNWINPGLETVKAPEPLKACEALSRTGRRAGLVYGLRTRTSASFVVMVGCGGAGCGSSKTEPSGTVIVGCTKAAARSGFGSSISTTGSTGNGSDISTRLRGRSSSWPYGSLGCEATRSRSPAARAVHRPRRM